MTKEVCEICTGSYTGEFSPKWRGPWAHYFDARGAFIDDEISRLDRFKELLRQGRVPLGNRFA